MKKENNYSFFMKKQKIVIDIIVIKVIHTTAHKK